MTLTGACNCGAIRFEVDGDPLGAIVCPCTRCQRRTGAGASPNIVVAPDQLRVVEGEDVITSWSPEEGNDKWFCPRCGSPVYASNTARPQFVVVRMGVLDEDPGVRPGMRVFTADAAAWDPVPDDGLTHFEAGPKLS